MARAEQTAKIADAPDAGTETAPAKSVKPALRKRDLIDRVAAETGLKKRQAKQATEALLVAMGEAVARGETLALEPFGRMRVARSVDREGGHTLTCKLRRKSA